MRYELWLGLRYLFAKRREQFIVRGIHDEKNLGS